MNKPKSTILNDMTIVVASGPYMMNGSLKTDVLNQLTEAVKSKGANVLILVKKIDDLVIDKF